MKMSYVLLASLSLCGFPGIHSNKAMISELCYVIIHMNLLIFSAFVLDMSLNKESRMKIKFILFILCTVTASKDLTSNIVFFGFIFYFNHFNKQLSVVAQIAYHSLSDEKQGTF